MKRIIDIPQEVIEAFKNGDINNGYYDYDSLIGKAIRNSTPLNEFEAEDCTNGDIIKAIFPSAKIDKGKDGNDIWIAIDCWTTFTKEWWNAPYKGSVYPKSDNSTLEDIKAELHATAEMHSDGVFYLRDEWIDGIIDKHISGKEK